MSSEIAWNKCNDWLWITTEPIEGYWYKCEFVPSWREVILSSSDMPMPNLHSAMHWRNEKIGTLTDTSPERVRAAMKELRDRTVAYVVARQL